MPATADIPRLFDSFANSTPGGASPIRILVDGSDTEIEIFIGDDGAGPMNASPGLGFASRDNPSHVWEVAGGGVTCTLACPHRDIVRTVGVRPGMASGQVQLPKSRHETDIHVAEVAAARRAVLAVVHQVDHVI